MVRVQISGLCWLAVVATSRAAESATTSMLRGSTAAHSEVPAVSSPMPTMEEEDLLQHTQCKCSNVDCSCSSSAPSSHPEEAQMQELLLNQTAEMHALWAARGGLDGQVACYCELGNSQCSCGVVGGTAEDPATQTVNETALLSDKEQALSMWWAGRVRAGGFRVGGSRRGFGCGGVRAGGCGCGFVGCRCAGVRGGGCRFR